MTRRSFLRTCLAAAGAMLLPAAKAAGGHKYYDQATNTVREWCIWLPKKKRVVTLIGVYNDKVMVCDPGGDWFVSSSSDPSNFRYAPTSREGAST